ncbi:MAG: hypothetical protein M3R06_03630 [Chloroflexota bacterium]|nr:hypothetical protein [Chloroflexota bacterium]
MATLADARQQVAADATNPEPLFKLAGLLQRAGETDEARTALTSLADLYDVRGQHAQADRVRRMMGTLPTTTEEAAASGVTRPFEATPSRVTTALSSNQTSKPNFNSRQTTILARPSAPTFQAEDLKFTVPLPGEEQSTPRFRALLEQSAADLQAGRMDAAMDSCIHALHVDDSFLPLSLRIAEIYAVQRRNRGAIAQVESVMRLLNLSETPELMWMAHRILLHTSGGDLLSLRTLVELLIAAERPEYASYYAAKLIQMLDHEGLSDEASAYSERLCDLIPGDTRAALENALILLGNGDTGAAIDRWETAVSAGADTIVGKAAIAALVASTNEEDHWRTLADVVPSARERADGLVVEAYARTAALLPQNAALSAAHGLLLSTQKRSLARDALSKAIGDRTGSPFGRALAAVTLTKMLRKRGPFDEHVAALRTSITLLAVPEVASSPWWNALTGETPSFEAFSLELGDLLRERDDLAGAIEVLKAIHDRESFSAPVCRSLSDALARNGQLGAALAVLDGLAAHFRTSGNLDEMADTLRQMSEMAPTNIKVKARLIDTYLQRGFVAEARAELLRRAELEERLGLIHETAVSLEKAGDLAWNLGDHEETFRLYDQIIALEPEVVDHRHAIVTLYLQDSRVAEAANHQRAIVDISIRENRRHEAIAALHQVIGLTPDDLTAYYQLAELLGSIGEYGQAERVYRRIQFLAPHDAIAQAKVTSMASLREEVERNAARDLKRDT